MRRQDKALPSVDQAIDLLRKYCVGMPEPGSNPGPPPAWLPEPQPELERLIDAIARLP